MRAARTPTEPEPKGPARELRADAKRNRERLVVAAEEVFTARGADASMDDVAKRAKVGIGTLYRHFATREALLAAIVEDRLLALAKKNESLPPKTSPADALAKFLEELVEHASTVRGLAASLGIVLGNGSGGCTATTETGKRLLARAQAAREIKRGVDFDDVVCMATAISLAAQQAPSDPGRARRLVTMLVDGIRTPAAGRARP